MQYGVVQVGYTLHTEPNVIVFTGLVHLGDLRREGDRLTAGFRCGHMQVMRR